MAKLNRFSINNRVSGQLPFSIGLVLIAGLLFPLLAVAQAKKPTEAKTPGQVVYEQNCLTCHQTNGSGVPNLNPPLRQTEWVTGDKTRLINVLLKGLQGQEVEGDMYDNVMPAHDFLTDPQIADVLTYIRSNFGNKASIVTADEVKTARGKK